MNYYRFGNLQNLASIFMKKLIILSCLLLSTQIIHSNNAIKHSTSVCTEKHSHSSSSPTLNKELHVEDDGFSWYELSISIDGKKQYGIANKKGIVLQEPKYDFVYIAVDGFFHIKKNGYAGICNKKGEEIIAPNKYESAHGTFIDIDGFFHVTKNGYAGICNKNGEEIIAPNKYEQIIGLGRYLHVKKNGYDGICDKNGREIIAPNKYKNIMAIGDTFQYKNDDDKWVKIDIDKNHQQASNLEYIDLGLPSGTLWKSTNEIGGDNGRYTYDEARNKFGNKVPYRKHFLELIEHCQWSWTGNGYKIIGPNGNSIYLPAAGCRDFSEEIVCVGERGFYMSSEIDKEADEMDEGKIYDDGDIAFILDFTIENIQIGSLFRDNNVSVRLIQENNH